jgi:hypothetical protein
LLSAAAAIPVAASARTTADETAHGAAVEAVQPYAPGELALAGRARCTPKFTAEDLRGRVLSAGPCAAAAEIDALTESGDEEAAAQSGDGVAAAARIALSDSSDDEEFARALLRS